MKKTAKETPNDCEGMLRATIRVLAIAGKWELLDLIAFEQNPILTSKN